MSLGSKISLWVSGIVLAILVVDNWLVWDRLGSWDSQLTQVLLSIWIMAGVAFAVCCAVRHLTRPLTRLTVLATRLGEGQLQLRAGDGADDEIGALGRALDRMATSLQAARDRLEEQVAARTQDLERSQAQLLRAARLAAVGELAAGVAHEINNPASVILMRAGQLAETLGPSQPEAARDLDVIRRQVESIDRIVSGMVTFARRTASSGRLEPVSVNDLVQRTARLMDGLLRSHGVDVTLDLSPRAPVVRVDAPRLEQVLLNLVNNAIDAMPEGGHLTFGSAVHANSRRAGQPFVPINCGALPETLVESEIFGYEKGAFTGAARPKPGLLEEAHGGTFFMDEVGELPPPLQVKFLRVLEDGRFRRLGSNEEREVDFRLICATNRNLEQQVEDEEFREDLYYRICTFPIHLPPLRERRDDIALLANHYLRVFAARNGKPVEAISPEAMQLLVAYEWRGNVRELQNVLERALVLASGDTIRPEDLPAGVVSAEPGAAGDQPAFHLDLPFKDAKERLTEDFEKRYIVEVLKRFDGNISRAAEHSGIDRRSLHRLLAKYQIDAHQVAADD